MSELTGNLRTKLDRTTDFKEEFDKMFVDLSNPNKKLPKDDLYYKIKEEIESKEKKHKKKKKAENKNPNANVLPPLHSDKMTEIQLNQNKQDAEAITQDMEKNPQKYPKQTKVKEPTLVDQLEKQKMAFQGNFEKLDDEIKVQVKALQQNDMETIRKLHAQEMTTVECQNYLLNDKEKKVLEDEEIYDEDLDRTMYQEFWQEIREFKKLGKTRSRQHSRSVARGGTDLGIRGGSRGSSPMGNNRYGGRHKRGMSGSLNNNALADHIIGGGSLLPQFKLAVSSQLSPQDQEIDHHMIKPQRKFNTIFEEYIESRKKFDAMKKAQMASGAATGGGGEGGEGSGNAKVDQLMSKINTIQKTQEIENRHVRETAIKSAEELLQVKLAECRFAYEEELEYISAQFEELLKELQKRAEHEKVLNRKIIDLENIITQQQNMMQTTGYYFDLWEDRRKLSTQEEQQLTSWEKKTKEGQINKKAEDIFAEIRKLLKQPFEYYTFATKINVEQSREIMDNTVVKLLQQEINGILDEKDGIDNELASTRKMTKQFKQTEEKSNKMIFELRMKYDMVKEEKQQQKDAFDIRMNTLVRIFVRGYNDLGVFFNKYKDFVMSEMDVILQILECKEQIIKKYEYEIGEFKLALKIPRQHYKYIENLRFAELMQQRDEIIEKLKKRYGIDPTKTKALLKMPDPSLPPEQQMEMMVNADLTKQGSPTQPMAKSNDATGSQNIMNKQSGFDILNSKGIQRDFSIFSLATAHSSNAYQSEYGDQSSTLAPSIRFGMHKKRDPKSPGLSKSTSAASPSPFKGRQSR